MVDSAFPLGGPPPGGWPPVVLIYAGGDTPHPWSTAEIRAMPARYRWPCWVRSNPGQVSAVLDAAQFTAWLKIHGVPRGTSVILDLETAVNTGYVNAFNTALRAAGYKVAKYGSESAIWRNPRTDGGTYVAQPGSDVLTTQGDTVARQYGFAGGYDRSILLDQAGLPLWDTRAPAPPKPGPPPPPPADPLEKIMAVIPVVMPGTRDAGRSRIVHRVQGLLVAGGFLAALAAPRISAIDGMYGADTTAAVKAAQKAAGATVDGITGPQTWGVLITGARL